MDIQDLVPVGGGSLRDFHMAGSEPVATFTQTQTTHPDEIWHPLGGEFEQGRAPSLVSSADEQGQATQQAESRQQGRPSTDAGDGYSFHSTARMVRSSLRPGG
jgi:hypothetical protein